MEGRVDLLMHQGRRPPYFVVDKASPTGYVEMLLDPLYDHGILSSALFTSGLSKGDSFILLSYGFELPYGFEVIPIDTVNGYVKNLMNFIYIDGGVEKPIPENYALCYPMGGNYELNHGGWFDFPKTLVVSDSYELALNNAGMVPMRISMYSVPADLDGKMFWCPFWVKIAHTAPLVVI